MNCCNQRNIREGQHMVHLTLSTLVPNPTLLVGTVQPPVPEDDWSCMNEVDDRVQSGVLEILIPVMLLLLF